MIIVRVQEQPFDLAAETASLTDGRSDIGAVATFTGLVRGGEGDALSLEHYPAMTERALRTIAEEACGRWPLAALAIIHRVGRLLPGDPIVMVAAASAHRAAAFEACAFVMDFLKTQAPFWKKEEVAGKAAWVEARVEDEAATRRWEK